MKLLPLSIGKRAVAVSENTTKYMSKSKSDMIVTYFIRIYTNTYGGEAIVSVLEDLKAILFLQGEQGPSQTQ